MREFRRSHEALLLLVLLAVGALFSLTTDSFLTLRNIIDLLTVNAFAGILCLGLMVILVSGGIDISFAAIASVAQYITFALLPFLPQGWLMILPLAAAVGILCGLANALIVEKLRVPSIIATIATLNVFFGLLMFFSGGRYITNVPAWFVDGVTVFSFVDENLFTYRFNLQILLFGSSALLTWLILHRSNLGIQIYALGGSREAARRAGVPILRTQLFVFGYMGLMAAVAAVSQTQLSLTVVPSAFVGAELSVLAAAVLGGASLAGGVGSVGGAILGVLLIGVVQNGLVLVGVSSYWLQAFNGLVIILAAGFTAGRQRRK